MHRIRNELPAQSLHPLWLAKISEMLAPGGTLLFVSHDKSGSPSGWSEQDLLSLTNPEEIVRELPDLQIEHAFVLENTTVVKAIRAG